MLTQDILELRHCWNRLVYRMTKKLPRWLQIQVRYNLFAVDGINFLQNE
jgi:hypothetical protein